MLRALLLIGLLGCGRLCGQGSAVVGRVVDTSPAGVAAFVRVVSTETGAVARRVKADEAGAFVMAGLPAGHYTVTAWAPGFRRAEVKGLVLREGERRELGEMVLQVASCDAPGVQCMPVAPAGQKLEISWLERILFQDYRALKVGCGADIDQREPGRCLQGTALADFRLRREGGRLALVAENGARLAAEGGECGQARYLETRLEIDGMGPGVDFCVKSAKGHEAHVYFTQDVEPGVEEIQLWYVIRGRR